MMWSPLEALQIFCVCYALPLASLRWTLPSFITDVALYHPIKSLIVAFCLPMVVYIVSPPDSPLRWATVPVVATLVISYLQTADSYISNKTLIAMSSGPTTLVLFQSIDYLVLQKLHLTSDGAERTIKPGSQPPTLGEKSESTSPVQRKGIDIYALKWGWDVVFNFRAVGTPRAVKNMPKWSYSDPEYVPSRAVFLLQRTAAFIGSYLVLDFLNSQPLPDLSHFTAEKSGQFSGFSGLTLEDIIARMVTTAIFWFSLRLTIALFYNGFSIIPVALMIHDPVEWPPYFGSVLSAYSVRSFWAVYWQQSLRNMLVGSGTFWTHGIFRGKKGTLYARYLNVTFPFLLSGLLHTVLDTCGGVPRSEARTWVFFVLQAVGIMMEDSVEAAYCWLFASKEGGKTVQPKLQLWHKVVGYVWVYLFMVWTTPAWSFANIRHADPEHNYILPFTIVGWFNGKVMA